MIRQKMIKWYIDKIFMPLMNKSLSNEAVQKERAQLLADARGEILEIGIGGGNNLPFYPETVCKITAVDPYVKEVKSDRIQIDLRPCHSEEMPFPDGSFDTVVTTFCLCSVTDYDSTLAEIKRVLSPKGRLLFLEHGRANRPFIQKCQDIVNPFFHVLACGCHVNRDHFKLLEKNGFTLIKKEMKRCKISPSVFAGYLYKGIATVNKENDRGADQS